MQSDIEALRQALAEHVRFHDDGLGCTADSEEWQAACSPRTIARLLDALELAQRDAKRLSMLNRSLEDDGYGHWLPGWCFKEGDTPPTLDEFRAFIDAAMKDAP